MKKLQDLTLALCAAFSHDGKLLAVGRDSGIDLWDPASGKIKATLTGHRGVVDSAAFSPDGRTLASAGHDATIRLWNLFSQHEVLTLEGHSNVVAAVAFSPDGNILASVGGEKTVRLWRAAPP